jgi:hypothetical protein
VTRRLSDHSAKDSAELCLVTKAADDCNFSQRQERRSHHFAGALNSSLRDVLERWDAYAYLKGPEELAHTQADELGQVFPLDGLREARVNMAYNATNLPSQEPGTREGLRASVSRLLTDRTATS